MFWEPRYGKNRKIRRMVDLRDIKIRIFAKAYSIKVQEELFKSGAFWRTNSNGQRCIHTDKPYLYVSKSGVITFGDEEDHFNKKVAKEVNLLKLTELKEIEGW